MRELKHRLLTLFHEHSFLVARIYIMMRPLLFIYKRTNIRVLKIRPSQRMRIADDDFISRSFSLLSDFICL